MLKRALMICLGMVVVAGVVGCGAPKMFNADSAVYQNGKLYAMSSTQMSRRYNVAGQLVQQVEKDNHGELISQFDFSYDAAGNIVKEPTLPKPDPVSLPAVTMTYSAANRLATYNGQAVQFDADGNLLVGPLAGEMANFSFDSRNRLVSAGETS